MDLADINMDYDIRQLPATVMDCFTGVLMSLTGWWGVGSRQYSQVLSGFIVFLMQQASTRYPTGF